MDEDSITYLETFGFTPKNEGEADSIIKILKKQLEHYKKRSILIVIIFIFTLTK